MKLTRFEDLECWKEARKLVNMVYDAIKESKAFQNDYRLKDQSIGAAISAIPVNGVEYLPGAASIPVVFRQLPSNPKD